MLLKPRSRFYHYVYWVDGHRVCGSTKEVDKDRALRVLQKKQAAVRRGDEVPHEDRLRLGDPEAAVGSEVTLSLYGLLQGDYRFKRNRSLDTMGSSFKHLTAYFGSHAKAVKLGAKLDGYVEHRRQEGAADASIRIELALLDRAFRLAEKRKLVSPRSRPVIEKPGEDASRVRQGFFRRAEVERLCTELPAPIGAVVTFLFFCPWRVGAARLLEWRDYSTADRALTLRREANKTKRPLQIPVDAESTPELMAVIEGQTARRRPDCPFIFHGKLCGTPRYDTHGNRRPCLGDFQFVWDRACAAIGMAGRIPHDLRRSGVKHYIDAGVDPHTVMLWSGHRTESMLRRYHIIDLDDLRRAGKKASDYRGPKENVIRHDFGRTAPEPHQPDGKSRVA